jgi:hypothetical protein
MQKTHTHRLYAQQEMANAPTGPGVHQTKRRAKEISPRETLFPVILNLVQTCLEMDNSPNRVKIKETVQELGWISKIYLTEVNDWKL